ncbi:MAG TPA: glucose-1-phosphate adenylyltransferase [Anaerolineae bacterium]|nr:glucose-1-phosphate adenylyltransferase [Anaerolineae bacterium]
MHALAMILAGGRGSRLSILSQKRAKPAVPFAGKYRIIDFPLSNCSNSGITTVGVLTQYRPRSLNDHIRTGAPWDLDRAHGGVWLLQPYERSTEMERYAGTANAIQLNFDFIKHNQPDFVVILAGDHIYKMNYEDMITFHTDHRADLTIGTLQVPLEEASRFGLLETDANYRVSSFVEKPLQPKTTNASMGIYVFTTAVIDKILREDEADPNSAHDFGKNIIPKMIESYKVYAYPFNGYWVDVGTVQAYWEAHMDLLADSPPLDLLDRNWIIHTRSEERPPVNIRTGAVVAHSLITDGCVIEGTVEYSVLSPGVKVARGAVVRNSIILTDTVIESGAVIDRSIVDKDCVIRSNVVIGSGVDYSPNPIGDLTSGISLVGKGAEVPPNIKIGRNCIIAGDVRAQDFSGTVVPSGATIGIVPPS